MKNRNEAEMKYRQGNALVASQKVEDILNAIGCYKEALTNLIAIRKAALIEADNQSIKDVLTGLIQGLNKLFALSSNWSQAVGELQSFLELYVKSFEDLNTRRKILPGLSALELNMAGPARVLSSNAISEALQARFTNCVAVISLFHNRLNTTKDHGCLSKDPEVIESFALYQKALQVVDETVNSESPVEIRQSLSDSVKYVAQERKPSVMQAKKKNTSTHASLPLQGSTPQTKRSSMRLFGNDPVYPNARNKSNIVLITQEELNEEAKDNHLRIPLIADDYRRAYACFINAGGKHRKSVRFLFAIQSYTEALICCKNIPADDFSKKDGENISGAFKALVDTVNQVTQRIWANPLLSSISLLNFLNFYTDNFEVLHGRCAILLLLDGLRENSLRDFLRTGENENLKDKIDVYLTVIQLFKNTTIPMSDVLFSRVAEINAKKEKCTDGTLSNEFNLFDKALSLVARMKGGVAISPVTNSEAEPEAKRLKSETESSLSSVSSFGVK